MSNPFFEHPILNSPYELPKRHWELDTDGQPTQRIMETRRRAEFISPIPKPKKRKGLTEQQQIVFDEGKGLSTEAQQYEQTSLINAVRHEVGKWRALPNPNTWQVTPETARLLQHWRHHDFNSLRPFFCQIEAVETAIWLTEVAPSAGKAGKGFLDHLEDANHNANPEIMRLALKLATGAGKTTVMAMLIAWQAVNAARRAQSKKFTRGLLIVTPGLTIRDRLREVLSGGERRAGKKGGLLQVQVNGVDVFHPNTGEVRSDGADGIACWFIDTDYNMESFFVRHAYFLGASDPYKALKTTPTRRPGQPSTATSPAPSTNQPAALPSR